MTGLKLLQFAGTWLFTVVISVVLHAPVIVTADQLPLTRPQIYLEDGNIYFIPAEHKNLVLKANGRGKILFNTLDLNNLTESVRNSVRELNAVKNALGRSSSGSGQGSTQSASIEQVVERISQIDVLENRLTIVERRLQTSNNSDSDGSSRVNSKIRRLRNRVEAIENQLRVGGTSGQNPCYSNPCRNAATCIPTIFGAYCLCRPGWEGERCDQDVNECADYAGSVDGCQNGGTCVNTPGSYRCQCPSGWFGTHCTKRNGDCSSGSNLEMCGHGICVNQHSGPYPYTCICDSGWTHDSRSPACNTDVNECTQQHTTCSSNPPVSCINTPGSYVCGPCPPGYTGNGFQCMDVNECLINNGGCSTNPMVQCTNTMGSRTCGPCPPGYMGNGFSCQYVGMCHMNNGGCHPLARCMENPMIGQSFVQCTCPAGYTGTGMGLNGCFPLPGGGGTGIGPTISPGGNPCVPSPCSNGGVCHTYGGASFTCSCPQGFNGPTCALRMDACASQPCQNGGSCITTPTGFICSCAESFAGDLCERPTEDCGGYLPNEEGSLRFPQSLSTYDHNKRCEWLMHTAAGKVFNLTFTQFHLEAGGSSCPYDYLEIRDGGDPQSPLLRKLCGNEIPGNVVSTHNALHITFRSDHNIVGLGFAFTWNSTNPVCGGTIEDQSHGAIQSPGYPGQYPHDRDCTWQFRAAFGKRVQLVFGMFQLETHTNCSYDFVEIRDGLEDTAPVLEKLCSTTLPAPVTSSGPYLSVRFHSDGSSSDRGFSIAFSQIPGVHGCGGMLTESTGVFSSPGHPQRYANGLECDWLIRLPSRDDKINLMFLTFSLESGHIDCDFDFVQVHDGPSYDSPLIGRFCGGNIPAPLTSSGNQLFIKFKTDDSIGDEGFSAKYDTVCGGEYSTDTGVLRSPFYPQNYPKSRDCVYLISAPAGKGINLQFSDFDIEPGFGNDPNCYFDFLEIRDGDTENSTLIGHYCGPPQSSPELITSSYNYLWIRFKTDASIQNKGFLANYSTFDTGCGGILRKSDGVIASPGHPEVYPHGVMCMWVIRGQPGQIVRLTFDSFSLEPSGSCRWDVVEVYDNSTSFVNGSLVGKFCGSNHPPQITSTDTTLTVIFKSDHSAAFDGFSASYRLLNASTACGGNYFHQYGVLKSPGYPERYPNSKTCVWVITAPRGRQIELNITDFDMEEGSSRRCPYDSLEIRNGPHATSPLVGTFCGNRPPPGIIPSFSNSLYVKFVSDASHRRGGFSITWDATSTGCGGVITSPSGSISSPNYPSPYGTGIECIWKIHVNQGSLVQIAFTDIDIQHSPTDRCWNQYVEILDGNEITSPSKGKFCSEDHVVTLQSTESSVTIKYILGIFGGNGRGFHLNYRAICNRVLKGFQGVIESPNFPDPYPHNRNCTWVIEASKGNKVNISFSHFDVEAPYRGNCTYDSIQVTDWKRKNPSNRTSLGTFCGSNRPGLISSNGDSVAITFLSDHSHARNGFRLEWKQYGCGGRIIGDFGVVSSPGYPRRYIHDVECIWKITTELGSKVELTIHEFDIENSHECQFDGLLVHGGPDETSPQLTKVCERVTSPTVVTSHGNNMYIKFYSDDSVANKGFYGYVHQMPGGCGGTYRGVSGFIYSPNYPKNYDHDDDCSWLISTDNNHVVELTFLDFNVERHINCSYDHVAIYDGYSTYSPRLFMQCGSELPNPATIRSTGNYMLVRLKTDGTSASRGFKASYKRGCGARLTGRNSGVISTPGYPGIMSGVSNCSWVIVAPNPDDRVSLTFTYMDLQVYEEDCGSTFIEVRDGQDYDAPSLYKNCRGGIPPTITSHGNALILHMNAVEYYHGHGFRAFYDISATACGGMLTSVNGSIASPNYPYGYPPNLECIWLIKAAPGNKVQLSFRRFEVDKSDDFCNADFVEIHERGASGPLLGHYCGNEIPSNITAAEQLWILFRTNDEGQAAGFWADYNLLHGVELSGSSGSIASPMFPQSSSISGVFQWRVVVNESYSVQITFTHYDFDMIESLETNCAYEDSITIYDGYDETAPVLLRTCSSEKPQPVITTGNVVYIEYNRVRYHNMFFLNWLQVQAPAGGSAVQTNITDCGGNYSITTGNITSLTSPGFPISYLPNLNCEWSFDAPVDSRIKVKVITMAMESHPACFYDKVELYDGVAGLPSYNLNTTLCQHSSQNSTYLSSGRFLRIAFKTDGTYSSAGFNLTLETECGGYVRDSRGIISSPNYPNNYLVADCKWKIIVRPGRTIRITFKPNFDIYSAGGQCGSDELILRNGANEESPFLGSGRYCGNTAPTVLETSGNHLYVEFRSFTQGGKGFAFTYEEVGLGCGGNIQLTDGAPTTLIQSPNYPQIPPPFTECEWIFSAPQGEAVQLTFQQTFEFSTSPGCQSSGVEVKDGGTAISNTLGVFCRSMPGTLKSTGNVLYVRYYTNVPVPRTGFKAEVKIATCGGVHAGRYGTITSPGFPATYQENLDCLWTIKAPAGTNVVLEFVNFNLGPGNENCTTDSVFIIEQTGEDAITPRNWTYCGNRNASIPNRIQTGTNEVQIRFRSDNVREQQATGKGFKLRFRARNPVCGGTTRLPTGFIQSPGYPQPYPSYIYCVWRIIAPPGRRVRIEFTDFELEQPAYGSEYRRQGCVHDELWINQQYRTHMRVPLYNQSLCGSSLPPPVETTSSEASIIFRTDGSISHRGFKLRFTTDFPTLCGGALAAGEGNLTSPNSTTNTPNTTTTIFCQWQTGSDEGHSFVSTGNGTTIITIQDLRIPSWAENDPTCGRGYVKISPRDIMLRYGYRKFCGATSNEKLYLPGDSFVVEYESSDLNSTFSASYRTVSCGGTLRGPEENVTSLNYPSPYPQNSECIWMVHFAEGSQIKVKFLHIDMDDHQGTEGCDRDYVIVRNGKFPTSPVLGKFCGSYIPTEITSMSNELWIEFHSDGNNDGSRQGFKIALEQVTKGCGGVIHRKYGQLRSPTINYNNRKYPHNTECEWIIETVEGYTLNAIFFDRFDIENTTNCTNDYVEIFSKTGASWKSTGRFCGRQLPSQVNTTSTSLKVVFRSNDNLNGDGFRMFWYSPCGGIYEEPEGIIRSAHHDHHNHSVQINAGRFRSYIGWEQFYSVKQCDYVIKGRPNDYIMVQFLDPFEITIPMYYAVWENELSIQCPRVNLTVWQANNTNARRRSGPYCGRELPPPFVSRGTAIISYNYMAYYQTYGFRVKYNKFECGGEVNTSRVISSPGNPFTTPSDMQCTWVLRAPQNKVVRFKFKFLEMEFHAQCRWDYIKLYDGSEVNDEKLLGTYCGNMTDDLPPISSSSGTMTVVSVTDGVIEHRGFEAAVDFTVGENQGCGGWKNLTSDSLTISSIDSDRNGKYDDNLDCQWKIRAQEFKVIEITFSAFNVEGSEALDKYGNGSCPFDFLEIRDGPGASGQLLAKLCGTTRPSQVISSSNFMWIRFVSDGSTNFAGFTLSARSRESPCGPSVFNATSTVQFIQSPNYPLNYDANVRCTWTINGARFFDEVDITFLDMDIEASPDCQKDRLEIRDLPSSYRSPEGIGGPSLFIGSSPMDWRFRNMNMSMSSILQDIKYCGSQTPSDFFTIGRSAEIVFHTDGNGARKGFKIAYKAAGCNRTYENTQGRIFSPEWPSHAPIFANCLSSIRAPNGSQISLYFNLFNTPGQSDQGTCPETALEVRDSSPTGPVIAQYCGNTIPDPVFSNSSVIFIKFFSRMRPARGYDITYTTTSAGTGCGGDIFHTGGSFTSPLHGRTYSANSDCTWRVRVPGGLRVQLQFTNFMIVGDCTSNFLEISALDSHNMGGTPTLFTRYCAGDTPAVYRGSTDMAIVRYTTSVNNTGTGWRATFKGVYPTTVPSSSL